MDKRVIFSDDCYLYFVGSIFITELCEKLTSGENKEVNLEEVLRTVQQAICSKTFNHTLQDASKIPSIQTPQRISSCRKQIVFRKEN